MASYVLIFKIFRYSVFRFLAKAVYSTNKCGVLVMVRVPQFEKDAQRLVMGRPLLSERE